MGEYKTGLEDTRIDRAKLRLEETDRYRWESLLVSWECSKDKVKLKHSLPINKNTWSRNLYGV